MTDNANSKPKDDAAQADKRIIRTPRDRPYVSIARQTLQDGKRSPGGLSFDERGALGYLLSKPDGWIVQPEDLEAEGGIGRDKVAKILKNLRRAGYLVTQMIHDENGRFVGKEDWIYETYQPEHRTTEKPYNGKTGQRKNRAIYSKESLDTKEGLNKKTTEPASPAPAVPADPPKSDEPKNERPKPFPVYDAIERDVFKQPGGNHIPRNWNAPVGGISKWLTGEISKYGRYNVGRNTPPATADDVARFIKWYEQDKPGVDLPQDFNKFVTHWRTWQATHAPATPAQAAPPAPPTGKRADVKGFFERKQQEKGSSNG